MTCREGSAAARGDRVPMDVMNARKIVETFDDMHTLTPAPPPGGVRGKCTWLPLMSRSSACASVRPAAETPGGCSPLVIFVVFTSFVVYATWALLQGDHYYFGNYLSPFYSPELFGNRHTLFGPGAGPWLPF